MNGNYASDLLDMESYLDTDEEDESYNQEEVDDMLEALMGEDADYSERKRQRRNRNRKQSQKQRKGVPTANGRSPYQEPGEKGFVTQKQFKEAMGRVGEETRRNAEGIKTVNERFGKLDTRVDNVVSVSTLQSSRIRALDTRMKIDGALDLVQGFQIVKGTDSVQLVPDLNNILKGVVKNGVLGNGKGALSNPWVIGGAAFALKAGLLGSLIPRE